MHRKSARRQAERADEYARLAEAEKRALIERLTEPSGKTEGTNLPRPSSSVRCETA
jgi:hypothetical protein